MQKITTFLWFDTQAEEAANFYVSVFKNSSIGKIARVGETGPKSSVLTVSFQLEGQRFVALNGGPKYKFTPAISLYVDCESQEEVDSLWGKLLSGGGREDRCGWLVDKYGLSWQIIPKVLIELLTDSNQQRAKRAMQAMLQMSKIDVKKLEEAASATSAASSGTS
jgi:predicted 3-demethylubiquinone-9 3-methyltransferase (glyoxalase superfamily)